MMTESKVLVTGSGGFLGKYLVEALAVAGYQVYCLDCKELAENDLNRQGFFIHGDIRNKETVSLAVEQVDMVVHAAAALSQFQPDEKIMRAINVDGTVNLLEGSLKKQVKKFIFISSVEVYGLPKVIPCPEEAPLEPICEYGRNKLEAENIALEYHRKGLPVVIFRPPTIAGPGQNEPFLLDQFKAVAEKKKVVIPGSGRARLQMVDARDVAAAVLLALENPQASGQVFNLGSHNVPTLRETVEALFRKAGQEPRLVCLPEGPIRKIISLWDRIGTPPISPQHLELAFRDSIFDTSRAEKVLGWKPAYNDLQSNLETLEWYLARKNGGGIDN
jgi:2-alkyl-3-oxoalkanoate reductase